MNNHQKKYEKIPGPAIFLIVALCRKPGMRYDFLGTMFFLNNPYRHDSRYIRSKTTN